MWYFVKYVEHVEYVEYIEMKLNNFITFFWEAPFLKAMYK